MTADAASVSALGADLVQQGERLRDQRDRVERARRGLADWRGPAAVGFTGALEAQLRVLDECSQALTEAGRALQEFAVDLQSTRARAHEAEQFCARHGLYLDVADRVGPPRGAYPVEDAAGYAHHVPEGQRLVDRARAEEREAGRTLTRRIGTPVAVLSAAGVAVDHALRGAQAAVVR